MGWQPKEVLNRHDFKADYLAPKIFNDAAERDGVIPIVVDERNRASMIIRWANP